MQAIAIVGLVSIAAGGLMFGDAGSRSGRDATEDRALVIARITGACLLLLGIALLSNAGQ